MLQTTRDPAPKIPWRRHYLDRPAGAAVGEVVAALAGVQTTHETGPPLALAARLPNFEPGELADALGRGRLVWMSAMRGSKFVLPAGMAGAAVAAFGGLAEGLTWGGLRSAGMDLSEVERSLDEVLRVLEAAGEPLTSAAVKRAARGRHADGALFVLAARGEVMRAGKRGSYTLRRLWLPDPEPPPAFDAALRLFLSAYLRAYGPVSTQDAVWWTGLPKAAVGEALGRVGGPGADGLWRAVDEPPDDGPPDDSLRLLPALDPLAMGWLERSRLATPEASRLVYTRQGTSRPAVLAGGRLVGTWELGGKVELAAGARVAGARLEEELERMGRALRREGRGARP